ncbi:MAG TPA: hypothetical protein VGM94_02725 [Galbitalea sp.]
MTDPTDGSAASAADLPILTGLEKLWTLWQYINSTRDMLADHEISGTHSASQITGVLSVAQLPSIPGSKISSTIAAGVDTTGHVKADSGFISADVYGRILTTSYRSVYTSSTDDRIGVVPSARKYKKNITPATIDPGGVLAACREVEFDYRAGGHDTGLIADDVAKNPQLEFLVIRGPAGEVEGLAYERLAVALLAVVRDQHERIEKLERIEEAGRNA